MKRFALLALAGLISYGALGAETLTARLTMVPIEMATRANITGSGEANAVLDGRRLQVRGSFAGMQGAATAARLHQGVLTGVRGPAVRELSVSGAEQGSFAGDFELTDAEVQSLLAGHWYIQVHSQAAPEGNLWGWFLR
jgi:hypothetical protein